MKLSLNSGEFPEEHLSSIGQITINFGDLEIFLMRSIGKLISIDWALAERVLGGDSFSVLLSKFSKLFIYKIQNQELLEEFNKIINKLQSVNERRNRYTHSYWIIGESKNISRVKLQRNISKNKSVKEIEENVNIKALTDFAIEIKEVSKELNNLMKKVSAKD